MNMPMNQHYLAVQQHTPSSAHTDHHLFISEEAGVPLLTPFFADPHYASRKSLVITELDICPVTTQSYQLIPSTKMANYISALLVGYTANTQVHIAGTDAFLWKVHQFVLSSGIHKQQVHILAPMRQTRRVVCQHCFTLMENINEPETKCSGCQRQLDVSKHYSNVHNAYLGTQANKQPCKHPAKSSTEDLF